MTETGEAVELNTLSTEFLQQINDLSDSTTVPRLEQGVWKRLTGMFHGDDQEIMGIGGDEKRRKIWEIWGAQETTAF